LRSQLRSQVFYLCLHQTLSMNLVFDIGANSGQNIDLFKSKFKKVIAFEPNPKLYESLLNYFSDENVIVDNRALSNKEEIKEFRISNMDVLSTFSEDWINNGRFAGHYKWNEFVEVQTTTLNSIINEFGIPDYIKIDVEGYEYEVLLSFSMLLENTIISFEWSEEQKEKIESILKHLSDLGYTNYSFTHADKVLFDEEIDWKQLENLNLIEKLVPKRKQWWGMIYVKK